MNTEDETPMLSKEKVNPLPEPEVSPDGTDKIRILVVEDENTTRILYDMGLFNQIFDKKLVVSGKEAIVVYDDWHPDIIVLDIYLPEMTGYQVLKEIRTTFNDKKTTIVMATSLSGNEDVRSCMKLGIEGYIIKPFQCMEIGAKILGYYAKKKPERARKAISLCREIAKQSQVKLLLDKNKSAPKTEEDTEGASDEVLNTETGEAGESGATGGEKEAAETPAKKTDD